MTPDVSHPVYLRLYRACLGACPPAFRREYGDEMVRDCGEAWQEAASAGGRALWHLRLQIAVDLVRTVVTQWARTGWPAIGLASLLAPLALAEGLSALARQAAFVIPPEAAHTDIIGVLLVATISVLLVATTIALTLWAARPVPPLRRPRR
jgi:hypothetical protein